MVWGEGGALSPWNSRDSCPGMVGRFILPGPVNSVLDTVPFVGAHQNGIGPSGFVTWGKVSLALVFLEKRIPLRNCISRILFSKAKDAHSRDWRR